MYHIILKYILSEFAFPLTLTLHMLIHFHLLRLTNFILNQCGRNCYYNSLYEQNTSLSLRKLIRNRERYHIYFYFIKYLTPKTAGITTYYYLHGKRGVRHSFPTWASDYSSLHRVQTDSRANPASYPEVPGFFLQEIKRRRREPNYSPPSSVDINISWDSHGVLFN